MTHIYIAIRTIKKQLWYIRLRVADEEKAALIPSLDINVNTKKPNVSQSTKLQPLNKNDTVRYCQSSNWTQSGIILNNNDIPQFYTLLNNKDNVIQRNIRHLIKMDSNFVKTENDNDMDNDVETEPKTRHSTSATKPGEVDEPRENATELRETSSYTTQLGRRVIKPSSRYDE